LDSVLGIQTSLSQSFNVEDRPVGGQAPCFIVAEIGANHDGDPTRAMELIEMAASAGADAVKFQTYTASELVADPDRVLSWGREGYERQDTIGALFDRVSLPRQAHKDLFDFAKTKGLVAFSTPFSLDGVDFLNSLNVPLWKVASSDVRDKRLLEYISSKAKPVILSTGKSLLQETARAVDILRSHSIPFAVLHCLAQYPAPMEEVSLSTIPAFQGIFPDAVVGFSDHTIGITAALGAVALGAKILERHVTYDVGAEGPDHWFSSPPSEFAQLCQEVRRLEVAMRGVRTGILPSEAREREVSVKSLILRVGLKAGDFIRPEHLEAKRPGYGIDPFDEDKVIGMIVHRDLPSGSVLTWEALKP
jgi:sialic acid synthase SpsE